MAATVQIGNDLHRGDAKQWESVVGQEAAVAFLRSSLRNQRWHHAYLFAGPEGVGKSQVADLFAQALLCMNRRADAPCRSCASCRRLEQGTHPDLIRLQPQGKSIGIEAVRELQRHASMRPALGEQRVALLEPAEAMSDVAQNALLKTLEEPPGQMVLVLISHVGAGVLPTISSRCLRVRFAPVPPSQIESLIEQHRPEHHPARSLIAALSDGRPGRALREDWEAVLSRRQQLIDMVQLWPQSDPLPALRLAAEWEKLGDDEVAREISILQFWFRDLLVLQEYPEASSELLVHGDRRSDLQTQVMKWKPQRLLEVQEAFSHARQRMRQHVNKRLNFDVLLLRISQP